MFTRCAIFEGTIKAGQEDAFFRFVEERLVPLWQQMPEALAVRVMRPVELDPGSPPVVMIQEIDYPSLAAIEAAMVSPVRTKARAETAVLTSTLFEGRFYHVVCERRVPA